MGVKIMGSVLIYSLIVFFISFGIISFFNFALDFIYETKFLRNKTLYTVIEMQNEACLSENIVRAVKFKVEKSFSGVCDNKIIFIDTGSKDATFETLKRLEGHNGGITVLKSEEIHKNREFFS